MKTGEAIKSIMKMRGIGVSALARILGCSQPAMSGRLKQDNISIAMANDMLKVLDYKVVLIPASTKPKEGWYEVE